MKNDFDAQADNPADEELSEDLDGLEISDLPPGSRSHYLLLSLNHIKQRLLTTARNVSRATLQDITQDEDREFLDSAEQTGNGGFELEISELPPTRRSHFLLLKLTQLRAALRLPDSRTRKSVPPTLQQRRHSIGRAFTAFSVCIVLLVLLIGNVPGLRTRLVGFLEPALLPTSTQVSYGSSITIGKNAPVIIYHFGTPQPPTPSLISPGSMPTTCPQISTLQYFTTPLDPPGLGAGPVWLSGFSGPSAALNDLQPIEAQVVHTNWPDGWYETLAIFIQKGYSGKIVLKGSGQQGAAPVWLSRDTPLILGTTLTLSLDDGSHYIADGQQWEMASVGIAVPTAGCYTLQASWDNNSWVRFFAAGA